MKTMNYESSKWSRDAIDDVIVDEAELARRRKSGDHNRGRARAGGRGRGLHDAWQGQRHAGAGTGGQGRAGAAAADGHCHRSRPRASRHDHLGDRRAGSNRDMPVGVAGEAARSSACWSSRPVGECRPAARRHQPLRPGAGSRSARRPDRGVARRFALPRTSSTAPRRVSRGFISQADMDRKRATRDATAARVRVAQANLAPAAPASAGSTSAPPRRAWCSPAASRRQVVGAGSGPCSASPSAARWSWSLVCPRPILGALRSARG